MAKLSEAQVRALKAMPLGYTTWGTGLHTSLPEGIRSRTTLEVLRREGLAISTFNGTRFRWTITEAGRTALAKEPTP